PSSSPCCGAVASWSRGRRRSCSTPPTRSCGSSSRGSPTDRSGWSDRSMTIARGAVLGALLAVVAVLAIILLSGGGGTHYHLIFETGGQLVKGDDVQIGGRRLGGVDDIVLTDDNQAEVVINVEKPYAPLHEGTKATIRLTSLSGVANRYIALAPGPNNAPEI